MDHWWSPDSSQTNRCSPPGVWNQTPDRHLTLFLCLGHFRWMSYCKILMSSPLRTQRSREKSVLGHSEVKIVAQKGAERRDGGTRQLSTLSFSSSSESTHHHSCVSRHSCVLLNVSLLQFTGLEWVPVLYRQRTLKHGGSQICADCWRWEGPSAPFFVRCPSGAL